MRISELRASHLANVGDRVTVEDKNGDVYIVERASDQEGLFYRTAPETGLGVWDDCTGWAAEPTLAGIVKRVRTCPVAGSITGQGRAVTIRHNPSQVSGCAATAYRADATTALTIKDVSRVIRNAPELLA